MKPLSLGKKIKSRVHHAPLKQGETGTVSSVHQGVFYGVSTGGGIAYVPAYHCDPPGEPDDDDTPAGGAGSGGGSAPGSPSGSGDSDAGAPIPT